MGRKRTIDRELVLDAAEAVVMKSGAGGLTFQSVADAAGVTKGGLQSCFGTKEGLINALLFRLVAMYAADVLRKTGPDSTPRDRIRAHVLKMAEADDATTARAAGLIAVLVQSRDHLGSGREWYAKKFNDVNAIGKTDRSRARVAFLATQGLFFVRHFGLTDMTRDEWEENFSSILEVLDAELAPGTPVKRKSKTR